jgi:FkbM family methyltransferase
MMRTIVRRWASAFRGGAPQARPSVRGRPSAVSTANYLAQLHRAGAVPDYEAALERAYVLFLKRGMTVLDIGAHLGRHTARFADLVGPPGRVIAFEPLPHFAHSLRDEFQTLSNVEVREVALGERSGRSNFVHVENSPGESGFRERVYNIENPIRSTIVVDTTTIDEQCVELAALDYVKMDIEGGEIDSLRGARDTITRCRPLISVEYGAEAYTGYGHTADTLYRLCEDMTYLISDLFGDIVDSREVWLEVCDRGSWDYFLVPRETIAAWRQLPWRHTRAKFGLPRI